MPTGLLDLPSELRTQIFSYLVKEPNAELLIAPRSDETFFEGYPSNLLLTCSFIYREAQHLYFTLNSFAILLDRDNDRLSSLIKPRNRHFLRSIRSMRIFLYRWGKKNFFRQCVIPFLEDCVLNGHLRKIEIWLRKSWVYKPKFLIGEAGINWQLLKNLMKDPYLELASMREWNPDLGVGPTHRANANDIKWLLDDLSMPMPGSS